VSISYPTAPRSDASDIYHGVRVSDPFRRLENPDDPATAAWVGAENALTRRVLDSPARDRLVTRLRDLHKVPRSSAPAGRGTRVFFTHNDGTVNQAALIVVETGGGRPGPGRTVLVDPNVLDADGTTAITAFEPDETGQRIAYALSYGGSDWQELRVVDASGAHLPDRLQWVKFASIAWRHDGFFYTRYPAQGTVSPEDEQYFCQVWHHRLGDEQSMDRLVYGRPDAPEVTFEVSATADGVHLVITSHRGASDDAEVLVAGIEREGGAHEPVVVASGFRAGWHFVGGAGGRLLFRTDQDAPFGRIVSVDSASPAAGERVVVAESRDTIVDATVAGGRLIVASLRKASTRLESWTLDGRDPRTIVLPGLGSILGLGGSSHSDSWFATFTSFTTPPTVMKESAGRLVPLEPAALPFDPAGYTTRQVWFESKDGTPISMFLVNRNDGRAGGDARDVPGVLLSGYGGFNISLTPTFDPSDFIWLDAGGTLAVANLRGGGEYGDAWHRAGMRDHKQQVFDDFIAAAEWLLTSGRAAPGRVAIEGASNGGLLVGAVMVQRPDLFGAVVCRVPVADMLRYHLFTVGRFWIPEYGCAEHAADFPFLYAYSPYHNVSSDRVYPPTLVLTADTDDRVAPGMAKKFAARLQEATAHEGGPIFLRVETRAGHGAGKPVSKQIDEQADVYAFLYKYVTGAVASEHRGTQHRRPD
jgi:prolyl oligopeptidase